MAGVAEKIVRSQDDSNCFHDRPLDGKLFYSHQRPSGDIATPGPSSDCLLIKSQILSGTFGRHGPR
jgi:hypothetical protein